VSAKKRLSEGKGNVIRQAEMLKDFGVKPTKPLPRELVENAFSEDSTLVTSNEVEVLNVLATPTPLAT
jgi:DNA recombination protein RmuC